MNCIKCGREIPEGQMLCTECRQPPMSEITAPVIAPNLIRQSPAKKNTGKKKGKTHFIRLSRRLTTALIAVCLLFSAVCLAVGLELSSYLERKEDLRIREASVVLREKEADNRDEKIAELEEEVARLKKELERAGIVTE